MTSKQVLLIEPNIQSDISNRLVLQIDIFNTVIDVVTIYKNGFIMPKNKLPIKKIEISFIY